MSRYFRIERVMERGAQRKNAAGDLIPWDDELLGLAASIKMYRSSETENVLVPGTMIAER